MLHDSQWERLASMAPDEVCRRAGVEYDRETGCYHVPLLNRRVRVDPGARSVEWGDGGTADERPPGFTVALVVVLTAELHPKKGNIRHNLSLNYCAINSQSLCLYRMVCLYVLHYHPAYHSHPAKPAAYTSPRY